MSITESVAERVRQSGLLEPRIRVLAMLSGGADSVCLIDVLRAVVGPAALVALHVNHGLRAAAEEDQRFCAELCDELGVRLVVERVQLDRPGNTEALAREARYAAAERSRMAERLDRIATGHTASDQVETVVYRLASSPGRRALLGMRARNGPLIRPLLGVSREETRAYCKEAGLRWREDETNLDLSLARNRVRLEILPALRALHPAADQNILATADQLSEEAELLERAVDEAIEAAGASLQPPTVETARLEGLDPALRRLVLRRLAEEVAAGPVPLSADQILELQRLAARGGSASLDVGSGIRAVIEYGVLRFQRPLGARPPEPARLTVPGRCRFGAWELVCELDPAAPADGVRAAAPDEAILDGGRLARELIVRSWRSGDRMRPLGLDGTKSLQDIFVDRKVPRSLRQSLPVVESDGEIAWVAGVALSDRFKLEPGSGSAVRIRASTGR
jgi:tRNA(Ile)-lysidine synthase